LRVLTHLETADAESYVGPMKPAISSGLAALKARAVAPVLLAGLIVGSGGAIAAESTDSSAQTAAPTPAKWVSHKLRFMYSAISPSSKTTYYSCDALQAQITSILRELGARNDLVVTPIGCVRPGGPEMFPGVDATFSVLEPAENGTEGSSHSQEVAARWDKVTLSPSASCALITQVKQRILPLFATRNVTPDCSPRSSVEVLRPIESPPPAKSPA
jgi:hypothetical protein